MYNASKTKSELLQVIKVLQDQLERRIDTDSERRRGGSPNNLGEIFHNVFLRSRVAMSITTIKEGRFVEVNKAFLESFGYSLEEAIGHTGIELGIWDNPEERQILMRRTEIEPSVRTIEVLFRAKDRRLVKCRTSYEIVEINNERCVLETFEDISDRVKTEKDLEETTRKYGTIIEHSIDGVVLIDEVGRVTEWNRAIEAIAGVSRDQVVGRYYWDVQFQLLPVEFQTPGRLEQIRKLVLDMLESGEPNSPRGNLDSVLVRPSGEKRFVQERAFVIKTEKGNRIAAVVRDVSEERRVHEALQKSEAIMRSMLSGTPVGVGVVLHRVFQMVNASFCRMSGYDESELLGQSTRILYSTEGEYLRIGRELHAQAARDGLAVSEALFRTKRGSSLQVQLHLSALDPNILAAGEIVTIIDITQQKQMEKALRSSMEQLRGLAAELEKVREEERKMISREVHDQLGQMLTAITMDLMKIEKNLPKDQGDTRAELNAAISLAESGVAIVQDISSKLRPRLLDDFGLIPAIEWQTKEFENHTDIVCTLFMPEHEPNIDEPRTTALFRILQEALTNVLRHAHAKNVEIRLVETEADFALSISDDGVGIREDQILAGRSVGLLGIRERLRPFDGNCAIQRSRSGGTEVMVRLPKPTV